MVGQSFVYSGGGERAKCLREALGCFKGEALFHPKANSRRHVGEKHKNEGLVMLQKTWQAVECSSLDNAAQYTTRSQCWRGPLGPALLQSC